MTTPGLTTTAPIAAASLAHRTALRSHSRRRGDAFSGLKATSAGGPSGWAKGAGHRRAGRHKSSSPREAVISRAKATAMSGRTRPVRGGAARVESGAASGASQVILARRAWPVTPCALNKRGGARQGCSYGCCRVWAGGAVTPPRSRVALARGVGLDGGAAGTRPRRRGGRPAIVLARGAPVVEPMKASLGGRVRCSSREPASAPHPLGGSCYGPLGRARPARGPCPPPMPAVMPVARAFEVQFASFYRIFGDKKPFYSLLSRYCLNNRARR